MKEQARIATEHAAVLLKVNDLLDEYAPTKGLGMLDGLVKLTSAVRSYPAKSMTELIQGIKERNANLFENLPECTCPNCIEKAGLTDLNPGAVEFIEFLDLVKNIIKTTEGEGIENFKGFSICALFEKDEDSRHTLSQISASTRMDIEEIAGMTAADFIIEYLKHTDSNEEGAMRILLATIERAKSGGKWRRFQRRQELEKALRGKRGGLADILKGAMGGERSGLVELGGGSIEEIKEKLEESLREIGVPLTKDKAKTEPGQNPAD